MINPLKRDKYVYSSDPESFKYLNGKNIAIPIVRHPGSFWHKRKNHWHEGIDLYGVEGESVNSIENGVVVDITNFTGEAVDSPWWNDTMAVVVKSRGHFILYGEISPTVYVGDILKAGDKLGTLVPVLKKDKGRPICMLHLECYYEWNGNPVIGDNSYIPKYLENPTILLTPTKTGDNVLLVAGTFDEKGGKRSGVIDKALKSYYEKAEEVANIEVVNGGNLDFLKFHAEWVCSYYDTVIWWANVDNKHEKVIKNINHDNLIISKNNRDLSYSIDNLRERIRNAGARKMVEFHKMYGKVQYRIHNSQDFTYWEDDVSTLIGDLI